MQQHGIYMQLEVAASCSASVAAGKVCVKLSGDIELCLQLFEACLHSEQCVSDDEGTCCSGVLLPPDCILQLRMCVCGFLPTLSTLPCPLPPPIPRSTTTLPSFPFTHPLLPNPDLPILAAALSPPFLPTCSALPPLFCRGPLMCTPSSLLTCSNAQHSMLALVHTTPQSVHTSLPSACDAAL